MNLSKLLLSVGLLTSFASFAEEPTQLKIEVTPELLKEVNDYANKIMNEDLEFEEENEDPVPKIEVSTEMLSAVISQINDLMSIEGQSLDNILSIFSKKLLVATPTALKMTYSDANFTEFKLEHCLTKPSSCYIWILRKDDGKIIGIFPFNTDEKGSIVSSPEKNGVHTTILLDEVRKGESFYSVLIDLFRRTVMEDTITPLPFSYPIGQTGIVRLSTKIPYPFIHIEGEGLDPEEYLTVTFDKDFRNLKTDRNGKICADLCIKDVLNEKPIDLEFSTSSWEQMVTFGKKNDETTYKVKINL